MQHTLTELKDIYYILHQYAHTPRTEEAQELLDDLVDRAVEEGDYSFANGLLGAGWLISYLSSSGTLTDDIDELLYDFDDNFYKIAIKSIVNPETTLQELLDILTYYQQRIQNKPSSHNFYRRFVLFETIKLLIEKLANILSKSSLSHTDTARLLLRLSYMSRTCMNEKEIEEVYYMKTEELIQYYEQHAMDIDEQELEDLYMLLLASFQFENPYWIEKTRQIIDKQTIENISTTTVVLQRLFSTLYQQDEKEDIKLSALGSGIADKLIFLLASNFKQVTL